MGRQRNQSNSSMPSSQDLHRKLETKTKHVKNVANSTSGSSGSTYSGLHSTPNQSQRPVLNVQPSDDDDDDCDITETVPISDDEVILQETDLDTEDELLQEIDTQAMAAGPDRRNERFEVAKKVEYRAHDGTIKRRFRPGFRALKEIRHYQTQCLPTIPKAPFSRLVREICKEITPKSYKFTVGSMMALQVSRSNKSSSLLLYFNIFVGRSRIVHYWSF